MIDRPIILIIGGLAMNAFIQASISFNRDQRNINSSQNLSAILEVIGSDIRQAGENINDPKFPAIEFDANTATGSMANSSKITVRRALTSRLTLCQSGLTTAATSIIVADNTLATVAASSNCDVGTSSSPLSVYRIPTTVTAPLLTPATSPVTPQPSITTYYPQAVSGLNPYPTAPTPLALKLPLSLRKARDYRCNTNPNTNYDSAANTGEDFCSLVPDAKLRIAVSSSDGQLLIFNQTDEGVVGTATDTAVKGSTDDATTTKKYKITVNTTFESGDAAAVPAIPPDSAIASNTTNGVSTVNYGIGDPIYMIEERVYTLAENGDFRVSINGRPPQVLIKKIANFRVSARQYTNSTDRIVQPTPAANICTVPTDSGFADQLTTSTINNPKYICKFNYFTGVANTDNANWKTLAGVKVELRAKYDGTGGQNATPTAADTEKLKATAEFFPRNVLSK